MPKGITVYLGPVSESRDLIITLLESEFSIQSSDSGEFYDQHISPHFSRLKDSCFLFAESPYVDKVYRDSYYHYYSSKHNRYKRDCIRISIFEREVSLEQLQDKEKREDLQKQYRGFIVLQPSDPFFIGRSVIAPAALKHNNFRICTARMESTVYGLKLIAEGFPHSSQNTETMSCAETTLWEMMEYFSSRYPEYRPALPSRIINTINSVSVERQLPSKGLGIHQISFALKEFGFGTRIYSRVNFGDKVFEKIISCYIESGIPVIAAVDNFQSSEKDKSISPIGHAVICIGHEEISDIQIDGLVANTFTDTEANKRVIEALSKKNITLYDYDEITKDFIFIDDNHPAYRAAKLSDPCIHYAESDWKKCKINHIIVPLYKRIHLEAFEAKNFIRNFLLIGPYPLQDKQEVLIRFFLTSSRSYKDKLSTNNSFVSDLKEKLLSSPLPKFIWVAELSSKELIKQKKANGVIILDATEAITDYNKPLVIAAYGESIIELLEGSGELKRNPLSLTSFSIYENNLKIN